VSEAVDLFGSNSLNWPWRSVRLGVRACYAGGLTVGLLYPEARLPTRVTKTVLRSAWAQDVYSRSFCGEEYFRPVCRCDPTKLVRLRQGCWAKPV